MAKKRRSGPRDYNDDEDNDNDNDDDARDRDISHHHHKKRNKKQHGVHKRPLSRRQKLDSELAQLEKQCAELSDSDPAPHSEFRLGS